MEVIAPLTNEEVGGVAGHPVSAPCSRCAMGRHCRGPPCKGMLGLGCRRAAFWW